MRPLGARLCWKTIYRSRRVLTRWEVPVKGLGVTLEAGQEFGSIEHSDARSGERGQGD
jgi:hypothetical protein